MIRKLTSLIALSLAVSFSFPAEARPYRVGQIPSGGDNVCANCHIAPGGGGPRNVFGETVEERFLYEDGERISVDWGRPLARLDSDGDGYTNGEELGDPDGEWFDGEVRDHDASLPGDASSTLCGDRVRNGPEECDGPDRDESCESLGLGGGSIRCSFDCSYDTSRCDGALICGDGILQDGEQCDTDRLRGRRCTDFGFAAGEIVCTDDCRLDSSGCFNTVCGDEVIEGVEDCEGETSETCESLGLGVGTVTCGEDCEFDTIACEIPVAECGDGEINGDEECDGEALADATCVELGFDAGAVGCTDQCLFDDTECRVIVCGDGVIDEGEECDGDDVAEAICSDFDLPEGDVLCSTGCEFDFSLCVAQADVGPDVGPEPEPDADPDVGTPDVGEPDVDADIDADTDGGGGDSSNSNSSSSGGGCATSSTSQNPLALAGILALLGLRRRRRI
jgi:MYXO-CTERM domain-containing protein